VTNSQENALAFDDLEVGDALPELEKGPISRTQLALFAGASSDHNPIHLDDEEARKGGLPGVIAHGMLNMAFLGQLLTERFSQKNIREFAVQFRAMAFPGDVIRCCAEVTGKSSEDGENIVDLKIDALNGAGDVILTGTARVVLPA
jgi:acyl dehydratase